MEFSNQQQEAATAIAEWLDDNSRQCFYLAGFAGTGKTTIARDLPGKLDGTVIFCAYTGKAAHVMRQKGCENASTIHSLIYTPVSKSESRIEELGDKKEEYESQILVLDEEMQIQQSKGRHAEVTELNKKISHLDNLRKQVIGEMQKENSELKKPAFALNVDSDIAKAALVVIDECSMVDQFMGADLLSFDTKILVLGDPGQLPPVANGEGFFTKREPDYMLTEIHRQAEGDPILMLANKARRKEFIPFGQYGESRVVRPTEISVEEVMAADQILTGTNSRRRAVNHRYREIKGFKSPYPLEGDKLVCLRNNHDLGLLNGSLWKVVEVHTANEDGVLIDIVPWDEPDTDAETILAHHHYFVNKQEDLLWWEKLQANEFDFGYALTVHKAQGSQWDDVLIYDESSVFRRERDRWLYTAITRAAKRVSIIREK